MIISAASKSIEEVIEQLFGLRKKQLIFLTILTLKACYNAIKSRAVESVHFTVDSNSATLLKTHT